MKHLSLNYWHDYTFQYGVQYTFFRLDFDSYFRPNAAVLSYVALNVAVFGLHVSLTFWPQGKVGIPHPMTTEDIYAAFGREHGEAGE